MTPGGGVGQFAYRRADLAEAVDVVAAGDLDFRCIDEGPAQAFADLVDRPAAFSNVLRP